MLLAAAFRRAAFIVVLVALPLEVASMAALARPAPAFRAGDCLTIAGRPRFVLGLYENPADDGALSEAVAAGFAVFHCPATIEALDRLARAGAHGWVNLGMDLDLSEDAGRRAAALVATVRRLKDHPALLLWEGPDEILWNQSYSIETYTDAEEMPAAEAAVAAAAERRAELAALLTRARDLRARGLFAAYEEARERFWSAAGSRPPQPAMRLDQAIALGRRSADGITAGIRAVRREDPSRPVWLNHAPRNSLASLKLYGREADMVGCDIYPIPFNLGVGHSDLLDVRPSSVGAYTDRMRASAPGKLCAMVLQGFGWRDLQPDPKAPPERGRRPTYAESRFMAYDAIAHGASAILYWGTAYASSDSETGRPASGEPPAARRSQLWKDLMRLARELTALEPALVTPEVRPAPRVTTAETFGSVDRPEMRVSLRRIGEDYVLICVNEGLWPAAFTLSDLPADLEGAVLYRLGTDEQVSVEGRRFSDGVRPSNVHVYATSRRFEPPAQAGTDR